MIPFGVEGQDLLESRPQCLVQELEILLQAVGPLQFHEFLCDKEQSLTSMRSCYKKRMTMNLVIGSAEKEEEHISSRKVVA